MAFKKFSFELGRLQLMLATALWISLLPNSATLKMFLNAPSAGTGVGALAFAFGGWLFVYAMVFALITITGLVFWGRSIKVLCAALVVIASVLGFFSLFLGTQFDKNMLVNVLQTHPSETLELLNLRLILWVGITGLLPAWLILQVRLRTDVSRLRAVVAPAATLTGVLVASAAVMLAQYSQFASAARNKDVSFHTVAPVNMVAAAISQAYALSAASTVRAARGADAHQGYAIEKPRLVVLVLGETARAQDHGLNGYERDTTPRMRAAGGIYFADTESCGTATAISLPCIFSGFTREQFSLSKGRSNETLIDVVARSGARVIWLDNDAGCKDVCGRAEYVDLNNATDKRWCLEPGNCFDEILLQGLEPRLRAGSKDTLLVLHLKGSHGPAYYKRYPPAFERFTPTCQSSDLSSCDPQTIRNAYDNTILYTDHMVGEVTVLLQRLSDQFATALLYVSDHGESLGEGGLYLHGMPYAIAPKEQTRVPMYAWVSPQFAAMERWDTGCMAAQAKLPRSHDYVYSTLLGMMEVDTAEYKHALDLFETCDQHVDEKHARRAKP
ncbi:MAG: Phosphoethanolamine transferase EptA [Pseudomonadota bacterium]|jgi:lipid A ethanolaminephosphotransferase